MTSPQQNAKLRAFFLLMGAPMTGKELGSLSIRDCQREDVEAILELWRQAGATPSATDNAQDLQRALATNAAFVLVAFVSWRLDSVPH